MNRDESKEEAIARVRAALDRVQEAQDLLDKAGEMLSPIVGGAPMHEKVRALRERIHSLWYTLDGFRETKSGKVHLDGRYERLDLVDVQRERAPMNEPRPYYALRVDEHESDRLAIAGRGIHCGDVLELRPSHASYETIDGDSIVIDQPEPIFVRYEHDGASGPQGRHVFYVDGKHVSAPKYYLDTVVVLADEGAMFLRWPERRR